MEGRRTYGKGPHGASLNLDRKFFFVRHFRKGAGAAWIFEIGDRNSTHLHMAFHREYTSITFWTKRCIQRLRRDRWSV